MHKREKHLKLMKRCGPYLHMVRNEVEILALDTNIFSRRFEAAASSSVENATRACAVVIALVALKIFTSFVKEGNILAVL